MMSQFELDCLELGERVALHLQAPWVLKVSQAWWIRKLISGEGWGVKLWRNNGSPI